MSIQGNPFIIHDSSLVLSLDAANIKSFLGEPTTNYCSRSNNFSSAYYSGYWTYPASLATGYSDPFGGNTAWAFPLSDAAGGPNSDSCGLIYGSDSNTNNVTTTTSMWFRSDTNISMGFGKDDGSTVGFTCTPDWQRITVTSVGINNYGRAMQFMVYRAQNSGVSTSSKIYIYGCQIEVKGYVTPYISTNGSFGTRGTSVETGGGLYDLTNGNNNGTLTNGPTFNAANGGSIVFDGTNDYVRTTDVDHGTSQFTLESWVYFSSLSSNPSIIKKNTDNDNWPVFSLSAGSDGKISGYYSTQIYGACLEGALTLAGAVTTDQWYHLCYSKGAAGYTTMKIHKNGVSQSYTNYLYGSHVNEVCNSSKPVDLGINYDATVFVQPLNGRISTVRIYNRQLSDTEILQNYNANKGRYGL